MIKIEILIVAAVLLVSLMVWAVLTVIIRKHERLHGTAFSVVQYTASGVAFFFVLVLICMCFPFQTKYMTINQYHGVVSSIVSTPVVPRNGETGGPTSNYLVKMNRDGHQYISTDPRLSDYHKGDDITLACSWVWNYAAADQLSCKVG